MSIWSGGQRVELEKPKFVTDAYIFFNDTNIKKIPDASVFGIGFYSPTLDYFIDCEEPKDCWAQVVKESYPKIFKKSLYKRKIADKKATYFIDLWQLGIEDMWRVNHSNPQFMWVGTTIGVLLNLLIYMGFTRIHFVNCNVVGYENYSLRIFLFEFCEVAKNHGVQCFSHDKMSPLNSIMGYQVI